MPISYLYLVDLLMQMLNNHEFKPTAKHAELPISCGSVSTKMSNCRTSCACEMYWSSESIGKSQFLLRKCLDTAKPCWSAIVKSSCKDERVRFSFSDRQLLTDWHFYLIWKEKYDTTTIPQRCHTCLIFQYNSRFSWQSRLICDQNNSENKTETTGYAIELFENVYWSLHKN